MFRYINIHVAMVRHSPKLVDGIMKALESADKKDRIAFNNAMNSIISVMAEINEVMEEMWAESLPSDYAKFRAFIMGIKDQTVGTDS